MTDMNLQGRIYDATTKACVALGEQWKRHYDDFSALGVQRENLLELKRLIGAVSLNLHNFTNFAYVPAASRNVPLDQLEHLNEAAWQKGLQDPNYHQELRHLFFPPPRVPSSMDMARLGVALLAEANLLRLTDVPLEIPRPLAPSDDPIAVAESIVKSPPPTGNTAELSNRLAVHLRFRAESDLKSDPKFVAFVAAVQSFLEGR
jgi:hypothetical protein